MNTLKRVLLFCGAVLTVLLTTHVVASAYPPGGVSVTTNASSYAPGTTMVLTAAGFEDCPNETVTFTITNLVTGQVTTVVATLSELGIASTTSPAAQPGEYQVKAEASCGYATSSFKVVAPVPDKDLPHNGSNTNKIVVPALVCTIGGIGMIWVARRRRSESDRV